MRATIMAGAVPDAVVVPLEALLPAEEGGSAVYVVGADSVAHQHKVQVGVRNAEKVQILSGRAAGDKVVMRRRRVVGRREGEREGGGRP